MTAETIARDPHGRRSGAGWVVKCPAHQDRRPSLSIREADGRVLVHCHSGCAQADVIAALRSRGLWPEADRPARTAAERREWGQRRREAETLMRSQLGSAGAADFLGRTLTPKFALRRYAMHWERRN